MPNEDPGAPLAAVREATWRQFGAAVDMLENAVRTCPESVWGDNSRAPAFWYVVYHTLFYLDFYLADGAADFLPPPPFTLAELDPAGVMPDRVYSRDELLAYLRHGRQRCRERIDRLTPADVSEERPFFPFHGTALELLYYNMRHVQHHVGQLHFILRQVTGNDAPRWVSQARD